jgi:hypothetical protein
MHPDGAIERPGLVTPNAATWRVTGAVKRNNFGHVTLRYSVADIQRGGIPWQFKNGRQRVFVTDFDHGAYRQWCTPSHSISAAIYSTPED